MSKLLLPFLLGPLARFPLELIWNYGSYKQLAGLLGWMISPVARLLLHTVSQTQKNSTELSMLQTGFESTIPEFERAKIFVP
jgi:hypothetical protein